MSGLLKAKKRFVSVTKIENLRCQAFCIQKRKLLKQVNNKKVIFGKSYQKKTLPISRVFQFIILTVLSYR